MRPFFWHPASEKHTEFLQKVQLEGCHVFLLGFRIVVIENFIHAILRWHVMCPVMQNWLWRINKNASFSIGFFMQSMHVCLGCSLEHVAPGPMHIWTYSQCLPSNTWRCCGCIRFCYKPPQPIATPVRHIQLALVNQLSSYKLCFRECGTPSREHSFNNF